MKMIEARLRGAEIAEDKLLTVEFITSSSGDKIYPEMFSKGDRLKFDIRILKFFF